MASTYSALKIELIATGEQSGTWGATTNVNLGDAALGEAITGSADVAFSSADVTITLTDTNTTQAARNLRLNLTGTSGGARNLILGSGCQIEKLYLVNNGLADAVTVKNTTGTGIAVAAGKTMFVYNNGTNVVEAVNYAASISTGAITCTSLTDSGLTSGRVVYSTTGGLLTDSANLLYSGTDLTVYNLTVGRGSGAVASNTVVGFSAGAANTTGSDNTLIGAQAGLVSTGSTNTAVGSATLGRNAVSTSGANNTALGGYALTYLTTGASNTAVGAAALQNNTSASNNTAVGYQAGYSGLTATGNVCLGYKALFNGTDVSYNTAIGYQSLDALTAGADFNVAVGASSLGATTSGENNTAIGTESLASNLSASQNTAVGYRAGYSNITGATNTFVGESAGLLNTAGSDNAYFGRSAGEITTGSSNTFIGRSSGEAVTTGAKNTIIGRYNGNAAPISATGSNFIVLSDGDGNVRQSIDSSGNVFWKGSGAGVFTLAGITAGTTDAKGIDNADGARLLSSRASTASREQIIFYNPNGDVGSIDTSGTATSYNTASDYRLKENIVPMIGALATVAQLKPVTYKWKSDGSDGQGFIAHELQAVVPDCVIGEKDAIDANGKPIYQGVDTSFLVATLVSAIQELKAEFDAYKATHP